MEGFGKVPLSAVTGTGNITQIYPSWNRWFPDPGQTSPHSTSQTAGDALPIAAGGLLLRPEGGRIGQVSVETDGTDGGTIQLFDINGLDIGADVSSGTAITNTQYNSLVTQGRAKLIWEENFAASPGAPIIWNWTQGFLRGLGARFVGASGTCALSIIGEGGFSWRIVAGPYAGG